MKNFILLCLSLFVLACNAPSTTKKESNQTAKLQDTIDSLEIVISQLKQADTTQKTVKVEPEKPVVKPVEINVHPISLHWISWDNLGKAKLQPLKDGWFTITGSQRNKNGEYLTIDGKIHRITENELEFDGTIVTLINTINAGEPCTRTGKQIFLRKGTRKYFRLQNMENCEGGNLVDYIDIYPGTSSLW